MNVAVNTAQPALRRGHAGTRTGAKALSCAARFSGEPTYSTGVDWRGFSSEATAASSVARRSAASRNSLKPWLGGAMNSVLLAP
jgi:hypothetical protein